MLNQYTVGRALKALYAGAGAFLTGLGAILVGNSTFTDITDGQWVFICGLTLGAIGGAYGLAPWQGPTGARIKPNGQPKP